MTKRLAPVALGLAAALALTACSSGSSNASSTAPAGSSATGATVDAATATSLADFGSLPNLVSAAKKEGALNVIALPRDWADYGEIIDAFKAKYPGITVNEASPDASSAEEIDAAKTNKGLDTAPDVFDLGLTVALQSTDHFTPYKVAGWQDIAPSLKEQSGLFTGDYGGYMSIGYDSSKYPAPAQLSDLLKPAYKGAVALNGDPTQAGAAFAAVGLAALQSGGSLDNFQPGIDFFSKLQKAGNLLKIDVTTATVADGETPVVFDWDYLNAAHAANNPAWKVVVLPGDGYAAYYNQAINKDAPHPAAARLWEEFLYSDQAQNLWLKGGARPVRAAAMQKAGTLNESLWSKLPPAPSTTLVPSADQSTKAGDLLGKEWAAAIS